MNGITDDGGPTIAQLTKAAKINEVYHDTQISVGALVLRKFSMGGRARMSGERLTADEVRAIPISNRVALIDTKVIRLLLSTPASVAQGDVFLFHVGGGRHVVLRGELLTPDPVTKEEGEALLARVRAAAAPVAA